MGLPIMRLSSCKTTYEASATTTPNPNKYRFEILHLSQHGKNCMAIVEYPDCVDSEKIKVCVFENTTIRDILDTDELDPHFVNNNLVARIRYYHDEPEKSFSLALTLLSKMRYDDQQTGDTN